MPSLQSILCQHILPSFFGMIFLGIFTQARAADHSPSSTERFSLGLGFEYASGTFGTETNTEFITVPLILDYRPTDRIDFELVIPYVYQSNSSTVYGAYMPYRYQLQGGSAMAMASRIASGSRGHRWGSGVQSESGSYIIDNSQSGIGDISITSGYELIREGELLPQLRMTAYLKFPTADRDMGLGTGEFDAGPGVSLDKWRGDWNLFAESRYVFQGESDLYATNDYLSYTAGIGYQLNNGLYLALACKGASAPGEGSPAPFEGRIKFNWRILDKTSLEGYLSKGFTDGSPDYGASLAVFRYF